MDRVTNPINHQCTDPFRYLPANRRPRLEDILLFAGTGKDDLLIGRLLYPELVYHLGDLLLYQIHRKRNPIHSQRDREREPENIRFLPGLGTTNV